MGVVFLQDALRLRKILKYRPCNINSIVHHISTGLVVTSCFLKGNLCIALDFTHGVSVSNPDTKPAIMESCHILQ